MEKKMEKSKKEVKVDNPDCEELLEELHLEWPLKFFVCKKHKEECFSGYKNAILSEDQPCELCFPKNNDSLGG
jgi:hypothetical protein